MEKGSDPGLWVVCRKDRGGLAIEKEGEVVWEAELRRGSQFVTALPYLVESVREMVRSSPELREGDETGAPLTPFPTEAEEQAALLERIAHAAPVFASERIRHHPNPDGDRRRRRKGKAPRRQGARPRSFYRERLDQADVGRTARAIGGPMALAHHLYDVRFAARVWSLYRTRFASSEKGLSQFIAWATRAGVNVLALPQVQNAVLEKSERRRLLEASKSRLAGRYERESKELRNRLASLGRALGGSRPGRITKDTDSKKRSRRRRPDVEETEAAVLEKKRLIEIETRQTHGSWTRALEAVAENAERPVTAGAIRKRLERTPPKN